MRRQFSAIVTISVVAVGAAVGGAVPAGAAVASGGFGKAVVVPGLAALDKGANSDVSGISCLSAGNCTASGDYTDGHHNELGFVATERNGHWGKATEMPGMKPLKVGGEVFVGPVACGSPGNCVAGGAYAYDETGFRFSSFVVTERGGKWAKAVSLNRDGDIYSISCPSGGNCVVAGVATAEIGDYFLIGDAFVRPELAGHWGRIKFLPGLRKLEGFGDQEISGSWTTSVECSSAGNCVAGGAYLDKNSARHGFVDIETNGVWAAATEVPGLAALNTSGNADVNSMSCSQAGDCVAGGYYSSAGGQQAFVAVETNGVWGTATPVPGLAALNVGQIAAVNSMSCSPAGGCVAVGSYQDAQNHKQVFVANENNGVWGTAIPVPGLAALNAGGNATVGQVSCGTAGDCAVGGSYTDRSHHVQGFVASENNGTWGKATPLAGLTALNKGGHASVVSVSCPPKGGCAAAGSYAGPLHHQNGFVTQNG